MAMQRLKADVHTHSADDPRDTLTHSAEELIDAAAAARFDVLALTLHEYYLQSARLARYAERRGVLLIPGIEQMIEGKHVVLLNPSPAQAQCRDFASLRALEKGGMAVLAPHPFFPAPICLGRKLEEHIDVFDAIEYSTMYCTGINFNRAAARVARKHGRPLLGTSDTHRLPYMHQTFTWIDAEPSVEGVIAGIRAGRTTLETRPRSLRGALAFGLHTLLDAAFDGVRRN